ncbi:MAG TPA: BF3164 family lipoprotein [Bacteroidales bacterium]|nr:BF3164 family lipoprotein [Bacteroidales bacterium]
MKKILFIIITIFLFPACTNNEKLIVDIFDVEYNIKGNAININKQNLFNPTSINVYDSLFLLIDYTEGNWLSLINKDNGVQLRKAIEIGKGPNEITYLSNICIDHKNDELILLDIQQKQIKVANLDSLIISDKDCFIKQIQVKIDSGQIFNMAPINDSLFVGTGILLEGKYALINQIGELINVSYDYPFDENHPNIDYDMLGMAFQSIKTSNKDISRFVSGDLNCDLLTFFTYDSNGLIKLKEYNTYLPIYEEVRAGGGYGARLSRDNKNGFVDLKSTSNYVYALYSGNSFNELNSDAFKAKNVLVFNWDGEPIVRFILDEFVISIDITEDDNFIYAIVNNPYPEIHKYYIGKLLKSKL